MLFRADANSSQHGVTMLQVNTGDATTKVFTECESAIKKGRQALPIPSRLLHFTDAGGVAGILAGKTLRLSLATALNDATEVRYGMELAARALTPRSSRFEQTLLGVIRNPTVIPEQIRFELFPFVSCFCADAETALHWLHYGRQGRGAALAFAGSELSTAIGVSCDLVPVEYKADRQNARIEEIIDLGATLATDNTIGYPIGKAHLFVAHIVYLTLLQLAVEFKDLTFESEREWRLIGHRTWVHGKEMATPATPRSPLTFPPPIDGKIVPFDTASFGHATDVLSEVIVGYSSSLNESAVQLMLYQHGFMKAIVKRSAIGVR